MRSIELSAPLPSLTVRAATSILSFRVMLRSASVADATSPARSALACAPFVSFKTCILKFPRRTKSSGVSGNCRVAQMNIVSTAAIIGGDGSGLSRRSTRSACSTWNGLSKSNSMAEAIPEAEACGSWARASSTARRKRRPTASVRRRRRCCAAPQSAPKSAAPAKSAWVSRVRHLGGLCTWITRRNAPKKKAPRDAAQYTFIQRLK